MTKMKRVIVRVRPDSRTMGVIAGAGFTPHQRAKYANKYDHAARGFKKAADLASRNAYRVAIGLAPVT